MEDETETTRNGRSDIAGMGWDRVGWARRQTGKHEDATSERTVSSSVSQSATDLTWMENRPLSRLDVKLVSGGAGMQWRLSWLDPRTWLMTVKCSGKLLQREYHSRGAEQRCLISVTAPCACFGLTKVTKVVLVYIWANMGHLGIPMTISVHAFTSRCNNKYQ